jgi:hypothetical protein
MPGCGGHGTPLSGSIAIVSWASQIQAVALLAPGAKSTRQMKPAKLSATSNTPGPIKQQPFSPPARSSKV